MKKTVALIGIISLGLLAGTSRLLAQATWIGADGANWNVAGNWSGTAPVNGGTSALVFNSASNRTGTNGLTNLTVSSLTYSGGADNILNGNAITLSGDVTDNTGNWQTINLNMGLTGKRTFAINNGQLTINGNLSDGTSAGEILKTGASWLYLTGSGSLTGVDTLVVNGSGAGAGTYNKTLVFNATNAGNVILRNTAALGAGTNKLVEFNSGGGGTLDLQTDTSVNQYSFNIGSNTNTNNIIIANRLTSGAGITHNLGMLNMGSATITINPGGNVTSGTAGVSFTALSMSAGNNDRPVTIVANASVTIGSGGNTNNTNNNRRLQLDGTSAGSSIGQIVNIASGASAGTGITSLIKASTGTWALTGSNTYTGSTTINGGILQFAKQAALYAGGTSSWTAANITVNNGGTLALNVGGTDEFTTGNVTTLLTNLTTSGSNGFQAGSAIGFDTTNASGGAFTVADNIANSIGTGGGAVGVTKLGSNTLILSGSNSFSGSLTVKSGTVNLSNQNAAQNSTVTMSGGNLVFDQAVSGTSFNIGGLAASSSGAGYNIALQNNAGTPAPIALTVGGNNANTTYAGVLSGSGSLTKSGSGTLTFSGQNTYTGGTIVNSGTLSLNSGGGTGSVRGTVTVNSGATLLSTVGDSFGYNSGTKVDILNIVGGTVTHTSGNNSTLSSAVINLTGGTLQTTSSGRLDLYNNGSGNTSINTLASATTSTIAGLVNLRQGDNNSTGTIFTVADGAATDDLVVSAQLVNGPFQGVKSIVQKSGPGKMVLSGSNTYDGGTIINAGTLKVSNVSGLGSTAGTVGFPNAGATLDLATNTSVNAYNFSIGSFHDTTILSDLATSGTGIVHALGSISLGSAVLTVNPGANVASGTAGVSFSSVDLSAGNNFTAELTGSAAISLTGSVGIYTNNTNSKTLKLNGSSLASSVSGPISNGSGTGLLSVEKAGTGTWTLSGSNSYTGSTTLSSGTLDLANQNALQNSTLTMNGGTPVFDQSVSGNAFTFGGLAASSSGAGYNIALQNNAGTPAPIALTVGGNNADSTCTAVLSGSGSLTKSGSGTLTLSGQNTYTGGTVVSNGTLKLNAGNSGTGVIRGAVTVNPGATLLSAVHDSFGYNSGGEKVDTVNILGGTLTHSSNDTLTLSSAAVNMTAGIMSATGGASSAFDLYNNGSGATAINTLASSGTATISGRLNLRNGDGATTVFTVADGAAITDLLVSGVIADGATQGTGSKIQKSGAGTMTLSGSNTYTGGTILTSGTLVAAQDSALGTGLMTLDGGYLAAGGAARTFSNSIAVTSTVGGVTGSNDLTFTGAASGTSGVLNVKLSSGNNLTIGPSMSGSNAFAPGTIKVSSGTLLLGGSNVIGDSTKIDLAGGTFNTGGKDETVGALTLSASSTIDFSSSNTGTLTFSSGIYSGGLLTIQNWLGDGTGGNPTHLVFAVAPNSSFLSNVQFSGSPFQGANTISFNGGFELAPVPEPATIIGAFVFVGLIALRERHRIAGIFRRSMACTARFPSGSRAE